MDRLAPCLRPAGRPAGFQRWQNLLFMHWPVAESALRAAIPAGAELDRWEGRTYVGLVPFTMRDVVPWWSPAVPGISDFHELNLRTYVTVGGEPGVFFFSLDAANSLAVSIARWHWRLPYHRARMDLDITGSRVRYGSVRRWPGPLPAHFGASYRIGTELGIAAPGTFEHFLAERYLLFTHDGTRWLRGQVHHRPYPLFEARLDALDHGMLRAAGLPQPSTAPHLLYSPGVDVDVYALSECPIADHANPPRRRTSQ